MDTAAIPGSLADYLKVWTVYERPTDYPNGFVARLHLAGAHASGPTTAAFFGPTLDSVRAQLPPGLVRLDRHACDKPQIVEVWL